MEPDLWDNGVRITGLRPELGASRRLSVSDGASTVSSSASTSSPAGSSAMSSSSSSSHKSHPHEAMFFLIWALMVGCFVTHALSLPCLHGLQQTVALFFMGLIYSFITDPLSKHFGPIGESYNMWMEIDPHLLLFTMLPPLLMGDAMSIDTSIAKRVARQCLFLAGPGVAINGFSMACFLYVYLPYKWPFLLCLVTGAILCATDPVAVVALLKELGASPTLTVQIQGESLLNDGTAIVMYTIAYRMLCGEQFDIGDIIQFLVKMAMYAWGMGLGIGAIFFIWIRAANNKFDHNSEVVQVALTLCCAYTSFIIAEGAFHISGVLSTVSAALVLAHKMWPQIVNKESMHTVWHMFEYLGNTVIFFLAGALTGKTMLRIQIGDYIHLLVIYLAATFLRGALLFGSRPLLQRLGADNQQVTVADVLVMTWGGLRGAIGLALAIQVQVDKGKGKVSADDADRVLFYVSGIASLTLMVNASTCPGLVNWLGITQLPTTKKKLLQTINRQLMQMVMAEKVPKRVKEDIEHALLEVEHEIGSTQARHSGKWNRVSEFDPQLHRRVSEQQDDDDEDTPIISVPMRTPDTNSATMVDLQSGKSIAEELEKMKRKIADMTVANLELLADLPPLQMLDQEQDMLDLAITYVTDPAIQRAVNEAFLALVKKSYWDMIEHGDFIALKGAETLLTSITLAGSCQSRYDLNDWNFIKPYIELTFEKTFGRMSAVHTIVSKAAAEMEEDEVDDSCFHQIVESLAFNLVIAMTILTNSIVVFVEQEVRGENEDRGRGWLVSDLIFQVIFTLEFVLKFAELRLRYFHDSWNLFDFFLVIMGAVGTVFSIVVSRLPESTLQSGAESGPQARLIRIAQVFRMVRIVRLFRLVRFWQIVKNKLFRANVSFDVAEHMQKTTILTSFITAHIRSQSLMVKYFGQLGKVDSVEMSRCILQSQICVYDAMAMTKLQKSYLPPRLLEEVQIAKECKRVAEKLEHFLSEVYHNGVISHTEAENLLGPLHEHTKEFTETLGGVSRGKNMSDLEEDDDDIGQSRDAIDADILEQKQEKLNDPATPLIMKQLIGFQTGDLKFDISEGMRFSEAHSEDTKGAQSEGFNARDRQSLGAQSMMSDGFYSPRDERRDSGADHASCVLEANEEGQQVLDEAACPISQARGRRFPAGRIVCGDQPPKVDALSPVDAEADVGLVNGLADTITPTLPAAQNAQDCTGATVDEVIIDEPRELDKHSSNGFVACGFEPAQEPAPEASLGESVVGNACSPTVSPTARGKKSVRKKKKLQRGASVISPPLTTFSDDESLIPNEQRLSLDMGDTETVQASIPGKADNASIPLLAAPALREQSAPSAVAPPVSSDNSVGVRQEPAELGGFTRLDELVEEPDVGTEGGRLPNESITIKIKKKRVVKKAPPNDGAMSLFADLDPPEAPPFKE